MSDATKRPSLAGAGGKGARDLRESYRPRLFEPIHPGNWLNPLRRLYAERLLAYIWWHGRKIILTPDRFADLLEYERLDPWAVRRTMDDLYMLGVVDVRMAGSVAVVEALADDLDAGAVTAVAAP